MQLSEVLRLFDSPLSQEQCWSICYCVCNNLISMRNEDLQRKERIHYILSLDSLILTQRGKVEILQTEPSFQALQKDSELIFAIGNLICRCLDYGLDEKQISEVAFQDDLAELIGGMVLLSNEFDEGIGHGDQFNEDWRQRDVRTFRTLNEVVRFCDARLLRRNIEGKGNHYKEVCKALYIEVSELKAFLGHVLNDFQLHKSKRRSSYQTEKDYANKYVKQWAKVWINVMEELRQKTSERRDRLTPEDYQRTPFSEVQLQPSGKNNWRRSFRKRSKELLPESLPANPEERIFDFLRSRFAPSKTENVPNNNFDRRTKKYSSFMVKNNKEENKQGKFSIFKSMRRKKSPSKFRSASKNSESEMDPILGSGNPILETGNPILEDIQRSSNREDSKANRSRSLSYNGNNNLFEGKLENRKQRKLERRNDAFFFTGNDHGNEAPGDKSRLQSNSVFVIESGQKDIFKVTYQKSKVSNTSRDDDVKNNDNQFSKRRETYSHSSKTRPQLRQTKSMYDNKATGCSLKEISKIRMEITRSELESAKTRILNESLCFLCRKTKFSFFRKSVNCTVCTRKYCSKCILKKYDMPNYIGNSFSWKRDNFRNKSASLPSRNTKGFDFNPKTLQNVCQECARFIENIDAERHEATSMPFYL